MLGLLNGVAYIVLLIVCFDFIHHLINIFVVVFKCGNIWGLLPGSEAHNFVIAPILLEPAIELVA